MDTITLMKLTRRYPSDGPMVEEWTAGASLAGEATQLPGGGLKFSTPFRPGVARGQRIEFEGRPYLVNQALDLLGRRERLVLTCAAEGA